MAQPPYPVVGLGVAALVVLLLVLHKQVVDVRSTGLVVLAEDNPHPDACTLPDTCGRWWAPYARLHARLLQEHEPRFLVYSCYEGHVCGGWGNRMYGMVSGMLMALLTDRVFLVNVTQPTNLFHHFDSPCVSLDYQRHNLTVTRSMDMTDVSKQLPLFPYIDLEELFHEERGIQFHGNNEFVKVLVENKRYRQRLLDMGFPAVSGTDRVDPSTVFACLLHFLIQPSRPLMVQLQPYLAQYAASITVGVQIRTGTDVPWKGDKNKMDPANIPVFIECAQRLGKAIQKDPRLEYPLPRLISLVTPSLFSPSAGIASEPRPVRIFLTTDSTRVQGELELQHGALLVSTPGNVTHTDKTKGDEAIKGLEKTMLDWLLLGACQAVVMSESTFSRSAVMRSLAPKYVIIPRAPTSADAICNLMRTHVYWGGVDQDLPLQPSA